MGIFEGVLAGLAFLIVLLIFALALSYFLDWVCGKIDRRISRKRHRSYRRT